jgi:hypothetical protein
VIRKVQLGYRSQYSHHRRLLSITACSSTFHCAKRLPTVAKASIFFLCILRFQHDSNEKFKSLHTPNEKPLAMQGLQKHRSDKTPVELFLRRCAEIKDFVLF